MLWERGAKRKCYGEANAALSSWERELDYKAQGFPDPCPVAELQQHHFTFLCLFSSHLWLQASESRNRLLPWADLMLSRKTHPHLGYFVPPNYNNFADFPQYFFSESLWLQQQTCSGRGGVNKHFNSQSAALFQRICHCPEIIILLQGQVNCVLYMLFSYFRVLLLIRRMGKAELSAQVHETLCCCLLTPPPCLSSPV